MYTQTILKEIGMPNESQFYLHLYQKLCFGASENPLLYLNLVSIYMQLMTWSVPKEIFALIYSVGL